MNDYNFILKLLAIGTLILICTALQIKTSKAGTKEVRHVYTVQIQE